MLLVYIYTCLYRFHYDKVLQKYGDRAELLMTDTDSLVYFIKTEDAYKDMYEDRQDFDLASYPQTSPFYDATNNKVIGKFKDEANAKPIVQFAGCRPKMYSLQILGANGRIEEKHRAKGIARAAMKDKTFQDFLDQLEHPHENYVQNKRIGSKLHKLYTLDITKRGLCAYDDKRFLCEDGINSLAFGHYAITQQGPDIPAPEQDEIIFNANDIPEEDETNEDSSVPHRLEESIERSESPVFNMPHLEPDVAMEPLPIIDSAVEMELQPSIADSSTSSLFPLIIPPPARESTPIPTTFPIFTELVLT